MLISAWIEELTGQQRMVEDLTKKIAARCEAAVWARIQPLVGSMDPTESRGYIRARSTQVIDRESKVVIQGVDGVTPSIVEQVKRSVAETVVRQMVSRVATQHPSELRRAA